MDSTWLDYVNNIHNYKVVFDGGFPKFNSQKVYKVVYLLQISPVDFILP